MTRGHWTAGKRRNDFDGAAIERLRRLLGKRHTGNSPRRIPRKQRVSRKAAALACGVSDRTIRRWLSGEDWPSRVSAAKLAKWIEARG